MSGRISERDIYGNSTIGERKPLLSSDDSNVTKLAQSQLTKKAAADKATADKAPGLGMRLFCLLFIGVVAAYSAITGVPTLVANAVFSLMGKKPSVVDIN